MVREYIGKDGRGREMYMYHGCSKVYVDHEKKGVVVKTTSIEVSFDIVMMFGKRCGAYIYDEISRRYGRKL